MKISNRRRLGVAVVVVSLLAVPALYFSGTPLLSLTSSQTEFFPGGFMAFGEVQVQWPLLVLCASMVVGLVALAWPRRRPPKLQA